MSYDILEGKVRSRELASFSYRVLELHIGSISVEWNNGNEACERDWRTTQSQTKKFPELYFCCIVRQSSIGYGWN